MNDIKSEFVDTVNVALSCNEGDFVIWDNCNRFIPIALDDLSELIFKLMKLEEYLELKGDIQTVDPLSLLGSQPVPVKEDTETF